MMPFMDLYELTQRRIRMLRRFTVGWERSMPDLSECIERVELVSNGRVLKSMTLAEMEAQNRLEGYAD